MSAIHRKSTQVHARPGQTESQVDPSFQLASTCDSVWPGLKVFKPANEVLNPSLKDLARQGLMSFTKHKRPISSEDLEGLYAANQLGLNTPESPANSTWLNTFLYFGKRGCENQRNMKPGDLQLKTTTRLKYFISSERATKNQSAFKCSTFYTVCVFTDVNSDISF